MTACGEPSSNALLLLRCTGCRWHLCGGFAKQGWVVRKGMQAVRVGGLGRPGLSRGQAHQAGQPGVRGPKGQRVICGDCGVRKNLHPSVQTRSWFDELSAPGASRGLVGGQCGVRKHICARPYGRARGEMIGQPPGAAAG